MLSGRSSVKSGLSKTGNLLVLNTEKCIDKTVFVFCWISVSYLYFQRFVVSLSLGFLSSVLGSFLDKCSFLIQWHRWRVANPSLYSFSQFSYPSGKRASYIILSHSPRTDCTRPCLGHRSVCEPVTWFWVGDRDADWGSGRMCVGAYSMPPGFHGLRMGWAVPQREIWCVTREGRVDAGQSKQMSAAVTRKMFYSKYFFSKTQWDV